LESMELRDLRAFAAVLELRGMTRAARRLHVVQSAVSQAVKRLEQEYGLQLLERRSDGVHPTPAGEELGRHAERILDSVARLEEDMASYRGHAKGVVNVGVVSTLAARLAAPLVRAVDEQLPDITLRIKEGVAGELLESLRLGRLDLVAVVSPVDAEDMKLVPTGELTLCFILRPDHHLADRSEIPFAEVANEPWISFPKSNPARRWLDDNSRKAGFRPIIAAEIETFTQMKAFVEAGHGIALAPSEFVAHELALDLLTAVPSTEPAAGIALAYAYDDRQSRPTVTAMREVLEEQLRRLAPRARKT
jgi:LysR family transcriptional regulator, nitrogen assimilation regulatory protein